MRITKEAAKNAAEKLVEKKREKIAGMRTAFAETVMNMYMATIPDPVRKVFDEHKGWIDYRRYVVLDKHGFGYERIDVKSAVPSRSSGSMSLEMGEGDAKYLHGRFNKIVELEEQTNALEEQISAALYGLKTIKNVEREFPEAIPFLPVHHTTALSVNVAPIRQLLSLDND